MPALAPPLEVRPEPSPVAPLPPPRSTERRRVPALVVIAILMLAIGGYVAYRYTRKANVPVTAVRTMKVTAGTLERTLRLSGQTAARRFANVTAPLVRGPESRGDMILTDLAPSGSYVRKGQQIARIDAQSIQDHIEDMNDTIDAAQADIKDQVAQNGIDWDTLQQTLRVAKADYEKARLDARAAEVKTDIERQLLELNLEEAKASYEQQLANLKYKKASQEAQLRILQLTRERHIRHRDRHQGDFQRFTIRAAMDGLVVMSPTWRNGEMGQIQLGDRVFPGQGFMKVVDTSSMQVEANINQTESEWIRIGQPAIVHLDAFPGVDLKAHVYSVGALAVSGWRWNAFIRTIPVRLQMDESNPKLIPDLSASADVVLDRAQGNAIVPLAAVHKDAAGQFVWARESNGFSRRPVELGFQNETRAIVTSGLAPGDEIRLN